MQPVNKRYSSVFCLLVVMFTGCIPPAGEKPKDPRIFEDSEETIYEVGLSLPYYIDYTREMEKLNLEYIMEDDGPYTFFIPLPAAFSAFLTNKKINSFDHISEKIRTEILLYHIIEGRWLINDISTGYYPTLSKEVTTKNPIDVYISTEDLFRLNGDACMDTPNIDCSNGMIHSIKSVLEIPDILTHLSLNKDFSMLVDILLRNDLDQYYPELLSGKGPFTFMAPANSAFVSLLEKNQDWKSINDLPLDLLNTMLMNHLIKNDNFLLKEAGSEQILTTAGGNTIVLHVEITKKPGSVTKNYSFRFDNMISEVLINDIQAKNGVIHKVDKIMIN